MCVSSRTDQHFVVGARKLAPFKPGSFVCSYSQAPKLLIFLVLSLKLTTWRRKTGFPDAQLQGYLRERLRLLQNDDSKARAVFSVSCW